MESYSAQSEDEVTFKTGDKIQVLSKSLDGWWKIRYNNRSPHSNLSNYTFVCQEAIALAESWLSGSVDGFRES